MLKSRINKMINQKKNKKIKSRKMMIKNQLFKRQSKSMDIFLFITVKNLNSQ
jgi:beta-lactamase regulating signal transducer with metallopeptidase domain